MATEKGLHILAYDKYQEKDVIISFFDDDFNMDAFYSAGSSGKILVQASGVDTEDYEPKRWSDLINRRIITEKERDKILNDKKIEPFYKKKPIADL